MTYINPVSGIIDQLIERDRLGRKRHPNQLNFIIPLCYNTNLGTIRVDKEMKKRLNVKAKMSGVSIASKVREYIEWGLENDK